MLLSVLLLGSGFALGIAAYGILISGFKVNVRIRIAIRVRVDVRVRVMVRVEMLWFGLLQGSCTRASDAMQRSNDSRCTGCNAAEATAYEWGPLGLGLG